MSDAKAGDPKPEAAPPGAKAPAESAKPSPAPAPESAKPAEPKPAAAEAKPEAAKPAEVKPAAVVAKAPEAKPAAVAAAAKAPEAKPAAPEPPKPGTVGVRAPAPKPPEASVNIMITAKAAIYIMGGLVTLVLVLGATTVFLLVRMTDRNPLARVTWQGPGQEGPGYGAAHPGTGAAAPAKAAGAAPEGPASEKDSDAAKGEAIEAVEIGIHFKDNLGGKPGGPPGSWPAFRGPKYDNIVTGVELANKWPKAGPPIKWSISGLAEGYSGPAAHAGRMYLQDYDSKAKEESLRCFSLEDGREIWQRSYPVKIVNNHGFTRTVPAVNDKYVVSMGSKCHVMCVDAQTGALKWSLNLMKDFGTKMPDWYTAQCPIIDGNTTVLAPGGKDILMMGVDLETGKIVWQVPNPQKLQMSHSSVTPMTILGKKMYVYCAEWGKILGVSADPATVGTVLWEATCLDKQVMAPSPVQLEDGYIFMTAGYKAGSSLLQLSESGGKLEAKVLWKKEPDQGLSCEQQTPIYYNKHLFCLQPDSSGGSKRQLVCMNPYDNGKTVWESGKAKRFGQYEPILLADGKFFVLGENCALTLVKASTQKYEELAEAKLLSGRDAWAPMGMVGDRLLVRDSKVLICVDVGKSIE